MSAAPTELPPASDAVAYAAVFAALPEAVLIQDSDGRFVDVNPAACSTYGYDRATLIGATPELISAPSHFDAETANRACALAFAGQPQRFRWWSRRADGSEFPQEVSLTRAEHQGRSVVVAVARDETERHAVETRLRASETRFRTLVEEAPVGIMIGRGPGYVYANAAARRMVGLPEDARDRAVPVLDMIAPECRDEIADRMRRRAAGEAVPTSYETTGRRLDGSRFPVHIAVAGIELDDGPGTIAFISDESERHATEEQRRLSLRMEAIGRLAGGVAHDFNNLLTAILSYSSLILCELADNHPVREDVEQIRAAGERAATLTRQLLAFGRRQHLEPKPVVLNAVVADLHRMLRRMIGEDLELATELAPVLWTVTADPGQLEQVIMNLVVNARDAMPGGGRLTIRTANVIVEPGDAEQLRHVRPGPHVVLTVSDTGHGIPPEALPHIFEPFFTTKEAGRGTGLGLATVYGIVKQSGGSIFASSRPGGGATFTLYFPAVCEPPAPSDAATPAAEQATTRGSETILLVEDDPLVRRLTDDLLRRAGYRVLAAENGEAALRRIAEPGRIDLVVTDVVMPKMSGHELVERLADARRGLPVLYVSGYTDSALPPGIADATTAFLAKPYTPATLTRTVRTLLDAAAAGEG